MTSQVWDCGSPASAKVGFALVQILTHQAQRFHVVLPAPHPWMITSPHSDPTPGVFATASAAIPLSAKPYLNCSAATNSVLFRWTMRNRSSQHHCRSAPALLSPFCFCHCKDVADGSTAVSECTLFNEQTGSSSAKPLRSCCCKSPSNNAFLAAVPICDDSHLEPSLPKAGSRNTSSSCVAGENHRIVGPNMACSGETPHLVHIAFLACTHSASANVACCRPEK